MGFSCARYFSNGFRRLLGDGLRNGRRDDTAERATALRRRTGFFAHGATFVEASEGVYETLFRPALTGAGETPWTEAEEARFLAVINEGRERAFSELHVLVREEHAHYFLHPGKTMALPINITARIENCCEAGLIIIVRYLEHPLSPCATLLQPHHRLVEA